MKIRVSSKASKKALILVSMFLAACCSWRAIGGEASLEDRLNAITEENSKGQQIEADCQKLILEYHSPEEQGKIYSKLSEALSQDIALNGEGVKKYSQKALGCPLDVLSTLRMYENFGNAVEVLNDGTSADKFAAPRLEAAKAYLQGLKLVLTHLTEKEERPLPGVDRFDNDGTEGDPVQNQLRKKRSEQIKDRDKIKLQNMLIRYREMFLDGIVRLYTKKPYNNSELEAAAKAALDGRDEFQQIINSVRKVTSP